MICKNHLNRHRSPLQFAELAVKLVSWVRLCTWLLGVRFTPTLSLGALFFYICDSGAKVVTRYSHVFGARLLTGNHMHWFWLDSYSPTIGVQLLLWCLHFSQISISCLRPLGYCQGSLKREFFVLKQLLLDAVLRYAPYESVPEHFDQSGPEVTKFSKTT